MYLGKVITAMLHYPNRPESGRVEEFICVSEGTETVWLIPTSGNIATNAYKNVPSVGLKKWHVVGVGEDITKYVSVVAKLESFVRLCKLGFIDCASHRCQAAEANLIAARITLTELIIKEKATKNMAVTDPFRKAADDYRAAKNSVYAEDYGKRTDCPEKAASRVGKILFVEFGETSGECICVLESKQFMYVVPIASVLEGAEMKRLPLTGVTILNTRIDMKFVKDFIVRLDHFGESYDDHLIEGFDGAVFDYATYDAAKTMANQMRTYLAAYLNVGSKSEAVCCGR